ncbi:hypothetical protein J3E69DRAFT_77092 [Trichoderma sp. SZMC 28015]
MPSSDSNVSLDETPYSAGSALYFLAMNMVAFLLIGDKSGIGLQIAWNSFGLLLYVGLNDKPSLAM